MFIQEVPTDATFIPLVMARTTCKKHAASEDEPCYKATDHLRGVCNARAKRAGFDHPISAKSKMNRGNSESSRKSR